mmetsp:Transcript_12218/g.18280  ORF Transcript_12218/g.18280 Transcript_12218/m.18280 type:complete len:275 (-) Transcript_12218:59-883(-)
MQRSRVRFPFAQTSFGKIPIEAVSPRPLLDGSWIVRNASRVGTKPFQCPFVESDSVKFRSCAEQLRNESSYLFAIFGFNFADASGIFHTHDIERADPYMLFKGQSIVLFAAQNVARKVPFGQPLFHRRSPLPGACRETFGICLSYSIDGLLPNFRNSEINHSLSVAAEAPFLQKTSEYAVLQENQVFPAGRRGTLYHIVKLVISGANINRTFACFWNRIVSSDDRIDLTSHFIQGFSDPSSSHDYTHRNLRNQLSGSAKARGVANEEALPFAQK